MFQQQSRPGWTRQVLFLEPICLKFIDNKAEQAVKAK